MRILLVIPPSPFLADAKVMASLGPLWVGASLRAAGHDVEVLDLEGRRDWREEVGRVVAARRPDVVGVGGTSAHWPFTRQIAGAVKAVDPSILTVLGGAHASMGPQGCVGKGFDVVVMDDGFSGVHKALEEGAREHIEQVPTRAGVLSLKGVIKGPMTSTEKWPLPARDLVDIKSYKYFLIGDKKRPATLLIATMGCPYGCRFCGGREVEFYRRYRERPIEHVVAEMEECDVKYGFKDFVFLDDEQNINQKWLGKFCSALVDLNSPWSWRAFVKSNLFNDDQAAMMAEAGCIEVCTGVESGSDRILSKWIVKQTSYGINRRCVEVAHRHGLRIKAFCMVGSPGESREDVLKTRDWILDARPDTFDLTVFAPYPGSPIFNGLFPGEGRAELPTKDMEDMPIEAPLPDFDRESWAYKTLPGEYRTGVRTLGFGPGDNGLEPEELIKLRDQIDEECRAALGQAGVTRTSPLFDAQQAYESGQGAKVA